jgi:predicted transcriptional regulator
VFQLPNVRDDVKKKILRRLMKGPANITLLSTAASCTRQTAKIHLTELERDRLVKSANFGNQKAYWL